ncbi:MAG: hypothetical protein ABIN58_07870, partial [candidate division WOR-3 bacterium]
MAFNPREVFPELFETEEPAIPQVVISPPKEAVPPLMQSEKASLGIETEKKTKFNPREVFPELFGPPPELPPEPIPPVKASLLPVSPFVIPKTEPQRLPERGILGDIGAAAVGGLRDVAEMGLRGLRTISPLEKAYEEGPLGKAIEALKDTDKWDIMKPSKEVVEGPWYRRWIYEGVRSALPSLSSMITGAAVGQALIPVPVVGAVAGAAAGQALSALPFGASEYDRFMEEAREKGLNEEEVKPYALASGLTEWMGETLGNWLGAKLLRMAPGGQQLTEPLKNTIRQMFKVPLKEGAKDLVKEYINEAGTEFGQNALENWLRTKAGMPQEQSPLQEGLESVGPTIVMTSIFGLGAGALNRSRRQQIYKALQDNTIAPEERRKAVNDITYGLYQQAGFKPDEIETIFSPEIEPQKKTELQTKVIERQKDPETSRQLLEIASQWDIAANTAIQNQQPINIDMTVEDYLDSLSSQRRTETAEEKEEAEPAPVVSPAKPAEQPPAPQKPKREVPWSVGEQVELQGKPYTILKPEEFDDFVSQKSKIRRITTLVKNGIVEPVPVPREEVKVVRKAGQAEAREEKPQEQPAALPQQPPPAPTPPVAEEAREKTAPKAEAVPE